MARLLAPRLGEALGQPVVVENRAGSNGNIAAETLLRAGADGHTLLLGMDSLVAINPHLFGRAGFDPLRDLVPVASLVSNGMFLVVHPGFPARSLAEFVEAARRASPPLQYASGGNGSQHHLTMERLKARAGFPLVHVPYKGGAAAVTATVAGEVVAMMSGTSSAGAIRAGRLRALAVTSPQRSALFPEVPAIAETWPDFEMVEWYGLFVPAGVPEAVIERLRSEVNTILGAADLRDRLRNGGGLQPWVSTARDFAARIRLDHARYGQLVRELGARPD